MTAKRVGILIFPAVDVLDFCGPSKCSRTRLDEERRREVSSPFEVLLVAETAGPVVATGGLRVIPDVTLETCPPLDILVVPGGWGTRLEIGNQRLLAWIPGAREARRHSRRSARAPCCSDRRACSTIDAPPPSGARSTGCASPFPAVTVGDKLHVVEDRPVVTSARISAGIDMALRVVARCFGEAIGRSTARHMEYPFPDDNRRRV
jgi:transcriptional regulator GlxA family with amidase domain